MATEGGENTLEAMLDNGRRLLGEGEYGEAAEILEQCVQGLIAKYGDESPKCASAFVLYARALMGVAEQEVNEEFTDLMQQKLNADEVPANVNGFFGEDQNENDDKEDEEDAEGEHKEEGKEEAGKEEAEKEHGEEDLETYQLAWEWLEVAKNIYKKENNTAALSEVLSLLGQIGLEIEQLDTAVEDFTECLELQRKEYGEQSRVVSETLYYLGLAYLSKEKLHEAKTNLENAAKIIEILSKDEKSSPEDQADLKEVHKEMLTKLAEISDQIAIEEGESSNSGAKRKPEETLDKEDAKKTKT